MGYIFRTIFSKNKQHFKNWAFSKAISVLLQKVEQHFLCRENLHNLQSVVLIESLLSDLKSWLLRKVKFPKKTSRSSKNFILLCKSFLFKIRAIQLDQDICTNYFLNCTLNNKFGKVLFEKVKKFPKNEQNLNF